MNNQNSFTDSPVHPGIHLRDTLDELGISQTELANRLDLSRKVINEIIAGKAPISPSSAILLERVLKIPAHIWNNLQRNYDLNIAYLNEQKKLVEESDLLRDFPVRNMINYGWIPDSRKKSEKIKSLLSFFSVSSLKNIENSISIQFRRSNRENISKEAVFAWLRKGELEIQSIKTDVYNEKELKKRIAEFRVLTNTTPDTFAPKLKEICTKVGVAVAFVPELPKSFINGATFWLDNYKKVALLLSLRFKTNDHLWFSFFHELGHIILHKKKENFLDIEKDVFSNVDKLKENEADIFAANILIPSEKWQEFKFDSPFSNQKVIQFAKHVNIAPGIVVGRLQKEKLLPYAHLNGLKEKYQWINSAN